MRSFRLILLLSCVGFYCTGLGSFPAAEDVKPTTKERVAQLIQQLSSPRFADRNKAAKELIAIGEPALGALKEATKSRDREVARIAGECIPAIERNMQVAKLVADLKKDDPKERVEALEKLGKFGENAEAAFAALVELLDSPHEKVRNAAWSALSGGGPKAVEQVKRALKHMRVGVRVQAVQFLEFKCNAADLITVLKDECPLVRRVVAISLRHHMDEASVVVPALRRALEDKDAEVRVRAATSLLDAQVDHTPFVDFLLEALNADEPGAVLAAVESLGWVGPRRKEALPALIKLLKSKDENIRCRTTRALNDLGKDAKPALPALLDALKDKEYRGPHASIAMILGQFGPQAKEAVPALVELLQSRDEEDRLCAATAIGKIRSGAKEAVPALIEVLNSEEASVRTAAAYALGNFGPSAKEAIPALEKCAARAKREAREGTDRAVEAEKIQVAAEGAIFRIQSKR